MKKLLPIILLIIFTGATAQRKTGLNLDHYDFGTAVSLSADYDSPKGNFGTLYKPSTAYGLNFKFFDDDVTMNLGVGYEKLMPKPGTFYYTESNTDQAIITYQDMTSLSAQGGGSYTFRIVDRFWVYGGFNIGAYSIKYNYRTVYKGVASDFNINEYAIFAAPKAGITVPLSNLFFVGFETKYTCFVPLNNATPGDPIDTFYKSFANGVSVSYKF